MDDAFDLEQLGGRVAFALREAEISIPQAASALGCTRPAIDQWIEGKTKNIKNELLFKLSDLTGFSARWIATGEGPLRSVYPTDPIATQLLEVMQSLPDYGKKKLLSEADSLRELFSHLSEPSTKSQ